MTLGQILEEKGCCPELILADQAMDVNLEPDQRRDAAKALMPYKWARLSAVEVAGEIKTTSIGIEPEAIKAIESILSRKK
jgi:hypothetical protein